MIMNIGAGAMSQAAKSMYGIAQDGQESPDQSQGVSRFTDIFKQRLDEVNALQLASDAMTEQMAAGNASIENTLIKAEEARIALDLTVQITSRITQAYQEIMRMQV